MEGLGYRFSKKGIIGAGDAELDRFSWRGIALSSAAQAETAACQWCLATIRAARF